MFGWNWSLFHSLGQEPFLWLVRDRLGPEVWWGPRTGVEALDGKHYWASSSLSYTVVVVDPSLLMG